MSSSVPHGEFKDSPGMASCGFCLLNNVAIGGAYALSMYGSRPGDDVMKLPVDRVNKIAIIDFDIHHGNGASWDAYIWRTFVFN